MCDHKRPWISAPQVGDQMVDKINADTSSDLYI